MTNIKVTRVSDSRFQVNVTEGRSQTDHVVTVTPSDLQRYGAGATAEGLVEASFRFLLEREPKESILRTFEISVIEGYFPEYPAEIRRRL